MLSPYDFFVHTASVASRTGFSPYGDTYAAPVEVRCFVEEGNKQVTNAAGDQITSTSTLLGFLADAPLFTPDTRVTFDNVTARVVSTKRFDSGALGLPDHIEVTLA